MSEQGGEIKQNAVAIATNGDSGGEGSILCGGGGGTAELSIASASELTADLTTLSASEGEVGRQNSQAEGEEGETQLENNHTEVEQNHTERGQVVAERSMENSHAATEPDSQQETDGQQEDGHVEEDRQQKDGRVQGETGRQQEDGYVEAGTTNETGQIETEQREPDGDTRQDRPESEQNIPGVAGREQGGAENDEQQVEAGVDSVAGPGPQVEDGNGESAKQYLTRRDDGGVVDEQTVGGVVTGAGMTGPGSGGMTGAGGGATSGEGMVEEGSEEGKKEEKESEWMDILGNGELLKKVLQPGQGLSTRPTQQSRVKVRTHGVLEGSGEVVDRHNTVSFTVGDGDVIQAWDIAVSLMEQGEVAQVKASARFAYGEAGKHPSIPGNTAITYELELLQVLGPVQFATITEEELIKIV